MITFLNTSVFCFRLLFILHIFLFLTFFRINISNILTTLFSIIFVTIIIFFIKTFRNKFFNFNACTFFLLRQSMHFFSHAVLCHVIFSISIAKIFISSQRCIFTCFQHEINVFYLIFLKTRLFFVFAFVFNVTRTRLTVLKTGCRYRIRLLLYLFVTNIRGIPRSRKNSTTLKIVRNDEKAYIKSSIYFELKTIKRLSF